MLKEAADIAIVVGGYNSSNTSHIVELLEEKLPTFFISSAEEIIDATTIHHYDFHSKKMVTTENYLGTASPLKIILTSGASCPDTIVDRVLDKLLDYFPGDVSKEDVIKSLS